MGPPPDIEQVIYELMLHSLANASIENVAADANEDMKSQGIPPQFELPKHGTLTALARDWTKGNHRNCDPSSHYWIREALKLAKRRHEMPPGTIYRVTVT
jgi:hypothetical protein